MVAVGTSELQSTPAHPFRISSDLKPGIDREAVGNVALHNTMEQPLAVRIHVVPTVTGLDKLLQVKASAGGKEVFRGRLTDLRSWSERQFVVPTHQQTELQARFWLPDSIRRGYQNRDATVTFEFKLSAARRGG